MNVARGASVISVSSGHRVGDIKLAQRTTFIGPKAGLHHAKLPMVPSGDQPALGPFQCWPWAHSIVGPGPIPVLAQ